MPVSSVNSKEDLLGVDEPTRFPPDYARMTPHREVEGSGEETLEEEGVGGEPLEDEEVGERQPGQKTPGRVRNRRVFFDALLYRGTF